MLKVVLSNRFKKDYKLINKRRYNLDLLDQVVDLLVNRQPLPPACRDHELLGEYSGCRECHIAPDWLLIYEIIEDKLVLYLTRTGTHSDLFKN